MASNTIEVKLQNNVINTSPYTLRDSDQNTVEITWKAVEAEDTFPETNYFAWKDSGGPTVERVDSKTLRTSFAATGQLMRYTIWMQENGGTPVGEDPEVDNRPPGEDDDTKGKGKGKDRP